MSRALLQSAACGLLVFAFVARAERNSALPAFRVDGLTYLSDRGGHQDLVVTATRAQFHPDTNVAYLENIEARIAGSEEAASFEMNCDRGELHFTTNDLLATGNVRGRSEDGRNFRTSWVRYDHRQEVVFTDAPVVITEEGGTYRGGGFRYYVKERRFRLLGGASAVQEPLEAEPR